MPLFGLRKNKKNEQSQIETSAGEAKAAVRKTKKSAKNSNPTKEVAVTEAKKVAMPSGTFSSATDAIIRPHVTEKTGVLSQSGVYTFHVARNANKDTVRNAVRALYKVTPVKIGIVNIHAKKVFVRGKKGSVPGMKKAIVTVKKGEKIDFV